MPGVPIQGHSMEFNVPMLTWDAAAEKWRTEHPPCQVTPPPTCNPAGLITLDPSWVKLPNEPITPFHGNCFCKRPMIHNLPTYPRGRITTPISGTSFIEKGGGRFKYQAL